MFELLLSPHRAPGSLALSILLGITAIIFFSIATINPRGIWVWIAGFALPIAIGYASNAFGFTFDQIYRGIAPLGIIFLGIGIKLHTPRIYQARAFVIIALILAACSFLPALFYVYEDDVSFTLLLIQGLLFAIASERGNLTWLHAWRVPLTTFTITTLAAFFPIWVFFTFDLIVFPSILVSIMLMLLASIYFVSACWWLDRYHQSYRQGLMVMTSLIMIFFGAFFYKSSGLWFFGFFLPIIWGFYAQRYQSFIAATLTLGGLLSFIDTAINAIDPFGILLVLAGITMTVLYVKLWKKSQQDQALDHWKLPAFIWAILNALNTVQVILNIFANIPAIASFTIFGLFGLPALGVWILRQMRATSRKKLAERLG